MGNATERIVLPQPKMPATAPAEALSPSFSAAQATEGVRPTQDVQHPRRDTRQLETFEKRDVPDGDEPFITTRKALGFGALSVVAALVFGPLALVLPLAVFGIDYAAHRGLFHRALDLVFEGLNGRPFEGPSQAKRDALVAMGDRRNYPLDDVYPALKTSISTVPLCDTPTPVRRLSSLEATLSNGRDASTVSLFVKDDGASNGSVYGGNKARKLELLLAQAHHRGDKERGADETYRGAREQPVEIDDGEQSRSQHRTGQALHVISKAGE